MQISTVRVCENGTLTAITMSDIEYRNAAPPLRLARIPPTRDRSRPRRNSLRRTLYRRVLGHLKRYDSRDNGELRLAWKNYEISSRCENRRYAFCKFVARRTENSLLKMQMFCVLCRKNMGHFLELDYRYGNYEA